MTALATLTPAQLRLAELAARLADANPDAAEELGKRLAWEVAQRKRRFGGLGVVIRWNRISQQIELLPRR